MDAVSETRNRVPETRNLRPETRNIVPETRNLRPETRNIVPETRNLRPETQGLEGLLASRRPPCFLFVEISEELLQAQGSSAVLLIRYLHDQGYEVHI